MKEACITLNIDYNKKQKKWLSIMAFGLVIGIFVQYIMKLNFGVIFTILMYIYVQIEKNEILAEAKKLKQRKQEEFINFLSYLIVFLENKFNVYQSIKVCIPYLDKCLKENIEDFVNQIDNDKTIIPYIGIANKVGTSLVMQIMVMLYQMDKSGYDSKYLNKFPYLLEKANVLFTKDKIVKQKNELSYFSMIPVVALLIIVFAIVFNIIGMVGGNIV